MSGFLTEIVAHKMQEVSRSKAQLPLRKLEGTIAPGKRLFKEAIAGNGVKLITEIKPASPSLGVLRADLLNLLDKSSDDGACNTLSSLGANDACIEFQTPENGGIDNAIKDLLSVYNRYASAISVLTDRKYFSGSLALLSQVVALSPHPVLCKDFIIDPYQVFTARAAGAEAVLLIVKILEKDQLMQLHQLICQLGMTPVVEIHNKAELEQSVALKPEVLLINNRDLDTFIISLDTTREIAPCVPAGITTITASGITCREDLVRLLPFCNRFLIGSALMKSQDLEQTLRGLSKPC